MDRDHRRWQGEDWPLAKAHLSRWRSIWEAGVAPAVRRALLVRAGATFSALPSVWPCSLRPGWVSG